jgi:hypothetical protein
MKLVTLQKDRDTMKLARFVSATKQLFYYTSGLTMFCRYCESFEQAERIVAASGIPQTLVQV